MHVLTTNRVLDTIISRKKAVSNFRIVGDFKDIYRICGVRGFFYGLLPYSLNYLLNNVNFYGSVDEDFTMPLGKAWFFFSLMMWSPLNI
jgi:hypothetical protein